MDLIVVHESGVFTVEAYLCEFFEKDIFEYIEEIKSLIKEVDECGFLCPETYYLHIAKHTKSVVDLNNINNPVFSYVGI